MSEQKPEQDENTQAARPPLSAGLGLEIEAAQKTLREMRYGLAWTGNPNAPMLEKMADGYWVPWHIADLLLKGHNLQE